MFQAVPCSSSGGQIVLLEHLVSSLCKRPYSVPVESELSPLAPSILYGHLQRVMIPDAVIIQFALLDMSKVLLETC